MEMFETEHLLLMFDPKGQSVLWPKWFSFIAHLKKKKKSSSVSWGTENNN